MADTLTIGQVSRLAGVPAKTIRFYEAEGVIARVRLLPDDRREGR
jgi:DNA-binding transcriptional MerR regulator